MSKYSKTPWIVILGADGAGKSTVIDGLFSNLAEQNVEVLYQHWRPTLNRKATGEGCTVEDPHALPPRGICGSWTRIIALLVVWKLSFLGELRRSRKQGKFVIFDRYYGDLIIDPRRYRYGGGEIFAKLVFKLMPQPDLVILLDGSAEVFYQRKPEVELNVLKSIVEKYRNYVTDLELGTIIDAELPVAEVVEQVTSEVNNLLKNEV